ncbi:MAG TPA: lysophospholipid acyltransferase family protein [Thermoanaerobaculia bacterium]|nr:lysophospholipid acyltransferase family protein [Thermoanaerobaculia bacterium]
MSRLRRGLATVCAVLYLLPATLILGSLAVVVAWVPPRGNGVALLARIWARGLLAAAGVRVRIEGVERLERRRGYLFMPNHQSYFDVVAMLAAIPGTYRFVAKRSLFGIPIFGWALWAGGFIPVDRHDRSRARDIWKAAGDRLARGASVLFYPEGTRSRTGLIGPFHRGAFLVALKTGAPIVPTGVSGAHEVMPPGTLWITPGTISLRFGEPLDPGEYSVREKDALVARVRATVSELSGVAFEPEGRGAA